MSNRRKNPRLYFDIPIEFEVLPAHDVNLPPELARVFQRVHPNEEGVGKRQTGKMRDLSSTGSFISGSPPPLLSRVGLIFGIPGFSKVEAIGWILWRRTETITLDDKELPLGFGVLFEYLSPEARLHIDRLVTMQNSASFLDELLPTLLE
ncbi:PilZ domain-containing protein [Myxococcota bacterium]|nr:PilZ domain-containing protein [Myxococcota bacterium]MBU1533666.1 PilZ domain-containing protein [Myxococcota bacterium]